MSATMHAVVSIKPGNRGCILQCDTRHLVGSTTPIASMSPYSLVAAL
jgi:hypothetical protein